MKNSGENYMWLLSFTANNQNNICAILQLRYVQHIWAKIHSLPEKLHPHIDISMYFCPFPMIPCHILWQKQQVWPNIFLQIKKVKSCSNLDSSWSDTFRHILHTSKHGKKKRKKASEYGLLKKEFLKKGLVICLFWFMRLIGLRVRF